MDAIRFDHVHALLTSFQKKYAVPAVGAAIATRDEFHVGVVGDCIMGQARKAAPNHQWHIGSCAKSMTAALYARLVEQRATNWEVPVAEFFPDLAQQIQDAWRYRTIDEVFVCLSGMRANLNTSEMRAAWNSSAPVADQRTQIASTVLSERPSKRGRFVYSNLGYVVIAAAIERISGRSYEDLLSAELLDPLEISTGGIGPPPDIWGHKCRWQIGNLCFGRGKPLDPKDSHSDNPPVYTSAGRLHFSLEDWARFQRIFLIDGSDFLRSQTIDHLLTVPKNGRMAMGWAPVVGIDEISYGMQGSNTYWSATSLLSQNRDRIALVVCNDGRTRILQAGAKLAVEVLSEA